MSTDESNNGKRLSFSDAITADAEARADAAVREAAARARDMVSLAGAKARKRIAEHERRMRELTLLRHGAVRLDRRTDTDEPAPARAAIAVRAYLKAERRGFGPGRETEDWLQAERELLALHAAPGRD